LYEYVKNCPASITVPVGIVNVCFRTVVDAILQPPIFTSESVGL
jgi:hypothetical protein